MQLPSTEDGEVPRPSADGPTLPGSAYRANYPYLNPSSGRHPSLCALVISNE